MYEDFKKDINDFINDVIAFKKCFTWKISIILTSTVDVFNNIDSCVQTDRNDRINTYKKSVLQWLEKTSFHIIIVENSGYDFPELDAEKEKYKDRFEVISFKEAELEEADYLRDKNSKGEHELFEIQYAYKNSKFIQKSSFIIKVTGRFFIPGFEEYLKEVNINKYNILSQHQKERCEMAGSNHAFFYQMFDLRLLTKDGDYDPFLETVFLHRSTYMIENVHRAKVFDIEPTQRGGLSEVYHTI